MNTLSIIIPCYNEEAVLEITYQALTLELKKLGREYEILFVNDGSKDRTFEIVEELTRHDSHVGGISLSRNFGKEGVLTEGVKEVVNAVNAGNMIPLFPRITPLL